MFDPQENLTESMSYDSLESEDQISSHVKNSLSEILAKLKDIQLPRELKAEMSRGSGLKEKDSEQNRNV